MGSSVPAYISAMPVVHADNIVTFYFFLRTKAGMSRCQAVVRQHVRS